MRQASLPQRQRKTECSEKDKLNGLEEGILIINVNSMVCWKQSPSSTGQSSSLHAGELHCTCSRAETDFPDHLRAFSFYYSLMLPCFIEQ